ncbi:phosphoglycerate mutase family protein [Boeremia exigua]|uniref:phosphoglycerate mutase family protein n=1 Tax=Boeremia exigua TaxID=749465 RepID=UPI001E8D80F8|nr:phosphoglycerate mutase family protein [Boeremia exigua]KAH6621805.1 phosphoglycerate mutase family protein [Boeremia exigua]
MSSPPEPKTSNPVPPPPAFHYEYTVIPDLFHQSSPSTSDLTFDFKKENFGLVDRAYPSDPTAPDQRPWTRFTHHLQTLNSALPPDQKVKLLFLARHGQGTHNVAESTHGTPAWEAVYARNPAYTDAPLTPLGVSQARAVHDLWAAQLARGMPAPHIYYVSPLTRALQTADATFLALPLPHAAPYTPCVRERFRETLGIHTCDARRPLSALRAAFPHAVFEPDFAEEDTLWDAQRRETDAERAVRVGRGLDAVFEGGEGVVSVTSHSGVVGSALGVLGHRGWALETGGVVPVVVLGRRVEGERAEGLAEERGEAALERTGDV